MPPSVRRCANRCEFCFIEGLPKGLRRNLYIRDDDYRLSFAYGNFATLSNLKERDEKRIIEYRLVAAVRLGARHAVGSAEDPPQQPARAEHRRAAHAAGRRTESSSTAQMVIVPGLNDGDVLEASLTDLWNLGDAVITVAVVPVGLTQFNHLFKGQSMSREHAAQLLAAVGRWEERGLRERGTRWVFGSDELYLLSGQPLPDADFYEDFPQIENGVGAVASLRQRLDEGIASLPDMPGRRIGVVTGTAMAPLMGELVQRIGERTGASFEVIRVENSLFGPGVTTAGLLVGADMRRVLADRNDLDLVLIPAETINDDGLFLDDDTFEAAEGIALRAHHGVVRFRRRPRRRARTLAGAA